MIVGIDIGGSHITAALVSEQPVALQRQTLLRYPVQSQGSADAILDRWAATILELWDTHKLEPGKIGIAMPGPFDYDQGIALMIGTEKYEALYGTDVRKPLAGRLGIPAGWIRFRNDAECFLVGEVMGGAGRGYGKVLGITLGTGLGSSIWDRGHASDADRWKLPFGDSFFEDYISTRFFVKQYRQLSGRSVKDARELAGLVATDELAAEVYRRFSENLSIFLRDFIRDEQPEAVVIGGNISNAWSIIYPWLAQYLEAELRTVVLRKAVLGEEAALVGGACSWLSS